MCTVHSRARSRSRAFPPLSEGGKIRRMKPVSPRLLSQRERVCACVCERACARSEKRQRDYSRPERFEIHGDFWGLNRKGDYLVCDSSQCSMRLGERKNSISYILPYIPPLGPPPRGTQGRQGAGKQAISWLLIVGIYTYYKRTFKLMAENMTTKKKWRPIL
jgi:hypothetical protein